MTPAMWAGYYDNEQMIIKLMAKGANFEVWYAVSRSSFDDSIDEHHSNVLFFKKKILKVDYTANNQSQPNSFHFIVFQSIIQILSASIHIVFVCVLCML